MAGMALIEVVIVWIAGHIESGPGIQELLEQVLPLPMRQLIGSQLGLLSFAAVVGFGFQHPFAMAIAIAIVITVATIPAGERESGFIDLVMARPVPRARYFFAVALLLAMFALIMPLAPLCGLITGLALVDAPGEIEWARYVPATAGLACLLLSIGGYTLLLASCARRRGTAVAQAAGLTLVMFWIDLTAQMWRPAQVICWLSPFNYFKPVKYAIDGATPVSHYLVLLAVFVVTAAAAYLLFRRRDL
jgi:ABC-type transport system involved in multi-copper enzyme maturation permease subunit